MSLIERLEQDDEEIMRAEDAALREAEKPKEPETQEDIASLIERLTSETPVHEG